jgi:signal transduction histidine kinase
MKPFRDLPMQKKMTRMTFVIVGSILLVSIVGLFTFQVVNFRASFQADTGTLAAVIANNSTASLAFKDVDGGKEVLSSLKDVPTIESATLLAADGSPFARYGAIEDKAALTLFPPAAGTKFSGANLLLTQPVVLDKKIVGTLLLRANFERTFLRLLEIYAGVVLGILVLSGTLAIYLSGRFQRVITDPVLHLAQTAQKIGQEKNYALRAEVESRGDELGQLAESFNEMLGRIQEQDTALGLTQKRMQVLINSIDGIVWTCNPETLRFSFVSRQCQNILGFPPDEWVSVPDFWEMHLHPEDQTRVAALRRELAQAGKPYTLEYRMVASDDRVVWIRESGSLMPEQGKASAMRGIFLDFTEQKLAADELERLNRRLRDTSRQAGMAEVATGVLHNVGNVLNSVSVSATLVSDRLKQSKAVNLQRAAAMLEAQKDRLADYLANDPKGRVLPEYLVTASKNVAEEQARLNVEMESVAKNIEHIKEIVAMQQNFAKVAGAYENLPIAGLVEDSLRINAAAFERHRIDVVRDFDPATPAVFADRHKALQILINLISNAKYAIDSQPDNARRLTIEVKPAGPARVKIAITDTGMGIPPENIVKIFNHGFTTKKDGHGFGLHSCANAAQEMGGNLMAHSDGPGSGATFTLELPVAREHQAGPAGNEPTHA